MVRVSGEAYGPIGRTRHRPATRFRRRRRGHRPDFARAATTDAAATRSRLPEIAQRHQVTGNELGTLAGQASTEVTRTAAELRGLIDGSAL
jgi:hypothetical protein